MIRLNELFYEVESIRGNWSVRALRRQMATFYFERSGLSGHPEKLAERVMPGVEQADPGLAIRDPYIFEFLGLRAQDALEEADFEGALSAIDNRLFVSKYQVELPGREELQRFLEDKRRELGGEI